MEKKTVTIKSQPLQPYQLEVYNAVHSKLRVDGIFSVLSPRQYGKSYLIEMLLFESCINYKNQVSIVIEPTLSQARKMANEMFNMINNTPAFKSYNAQLLEMKFENGSQIIFKSVEQGSISLRGYTISKNGYLIIDEAAYCDDELFYNATALCNRWKAPIVLFSTPRWKCGFFHYYCSTDDNNVHFFDWSKYKNPFITEERLEMFRNQMPPILFMSEFMGEWMENNSDVFGDYQSVMSNLIDYSGERTMAVDWGAGKLADNNDSDYTAVSIMNNTRCQIFADQWNDLDETQTISRICDTATKWAVKKIVVEQNSIGAIYLGLLRKEVAKRGLRISIVPMNTTNQLKNEMVQYFIVHIQNKTVQLLDNQVLKLQMNVYKMEKTKSGKVTYNAASGYHDDMLFATMLNLHSLKQGTYRLR